MDRPSKASSQSPDAPARSNSNRGRERVEKWSEDRSFNKMVREPKIQSPRQSVAPAGMTAARSVFSRAQQLQEQASAYWMLTVEIMHKAAQVGQEIGDYALELSCTVMGKDPAVVREALGKIWSRGVETASHVWEKAEPYVMNYMPEDRSPLWVCSVVALVFCLTIAGLTIDVKRFGASKKAETSPFTAPRIQLPDGRYISYREQGVAADVARYSILILHGFPSSRLAGIPGIRDSLLWEFGVRLVAYDRPGFGESDPHPRRSLRSSAQDMVHIADALGMGEKFWILGHAAGGIHAWAAIKYIPDRLAGVAMFAPWGNPYAVNMTKEESHKSWGALTLRGKLMFILARRAPSLLRSFYKRTLIKKPDKFNNGLIVRVGKKDQTLVEQEFFVQEFNRDVQESIRQRNAATLAEEMNMLVRDWGFHLSDLCMRKKKPEPLMGFLQRLKSLFGHEIPEEWEGFPGPIHIWQGTDDLLVPSGMNEFAAQMVPQATLHKLEGEGHFSFYCFCDQCHREIFGTLFGNPEGTINSTKSAEPLENV